MTRVKDLVQHVISEDMRSNLRKRARMTPSDFEAIKFDKESELFRLFEQQPVWTKKGLSDALRLDIKYVGVLTTECCVKTANRRWALKPEFICSLP